MSLPEDFVFSQSALQDYVECPRRFELRYLRDVRWPALETAPALEHEEKMMRGQEFHHLIHQHVLGVPIEAIEPTIGDDQIRAWWERWRDWQREHLPEKRQAEITLTAPLADSLLMAKYDLVAKLPGDAFLIVDWKTSKPQRRVYLANRMQTLVYPLVLAKAGAWLNGDAPIAPEQIRFLYWFAESGETVEFQQDAQTLQTAEARLTAMIQEITARYDFEKTEDLRRCRFCAYRSLCERGEVAGRLDELEDDDAMSSEFSLDLDEIEEIAF